LKQLLILLACLLSLDAFSHGGDSGPATLEEEFSKMSHLHLPFNYSSHEGYYFGYEIGKSEDGHSTENHPIIFGGADKIKRLTCLESTSTNLIEVCPESSAHQLLENSKWDLGLGLESHIHLPIPGVGFGVGLSYLKGKSYYSLKQLNHKKEKRSKLAFPLNPTEFKNWRVNDQLFYMSKGTLVLNVFVGYEPFIHLGPQVSRTGMYRISLKKTDEKTIVAQIGSLKSKDFTFEGYAILAGAEFNAGRAKTNSVTYEFNMEDENNYPILASFVAGRLDLVNQALLSSSGSIIMKSDAINTGRSLMASIGLPMLFNNGGYRGTYLSRGTVEELEEGKLHHHDVFTRSKVKDHSTRGVLSDHLWENQTLSATIIREEDAPTESILSVVLNWSFSRDHLKHAQFARKLKKAAKITGIDKLQEIKIPAEARGYVKVDVTINMAAEHILKILTKEQKEALEKLQVKSDYQGMNKKLIRIMNEYFKQNNGWFAENKPVIQIKVEGESLKQSLIQL
jgi:hypothetical protein